MHRDHDAIAAVASGSGASAVAIIRVSGKNALGLVSPALSFLSKKAARALHYGKFCDPKSHAIIDDVMAVSFISPQSFTGEDSVEIFCHGGPYIVRRIMATLYSLGARPADPGEFTRRAFLNGKMDLTEAEGIGALVSAESEHQWVAARQLATGRLKETIEALRTRLIECLAYLEAQIDFPDEGDTAHLHLEHVKTRAASVRAAITKLLATYDDGKVAARGLSVALFGAPNAGKSTLMNELLGRERAIVSDIAGTTRDYIEEPCLAGGRLIRLIDMAGVRATGETDDPIEKIGIASALQLTREADLVLFLAPADADENAAGAVERWIKDLAPRQYLRVLTKADLASPLWAKIGPWHALSCRANSGISQLKTELAARVDAHVSGLKEDTFLTSARHVAALEAALGGIDKYFAAAASSAYEEMLAFELKEAVRSLEEVIGRVDHEDVLDKIFSEFCIGK